MTTGKDQFWYRNGEAFCESVGLARIAKEVGTPAYIYSRAMLSENCHMIRGAFASYPTLPCYAVKANSNQAVLKQIFSHGFGADVVSVGELERALLAGAKPEQIVFSGVGKQETEIERAIEVGILSFNVESTGEIAMLERIATAKGVTVNIMLRLNPNIDVKTNPYIATGLYSTKFGIAEDEAMQIARTLADHPHIKLVGLSCHLGSQIFDIEPYQQTAVRLAGLAGECMALGHNLGYLDLGGGFAIQYKDEVPPSMESYAKAIFSAVRKTELRLIIEPGRSVVGNSGILLTRVIGTKKTPTKQFVIVDAAMNDLIRPSLYEAYHEILPVNQSNEVSVRVDVVGPVCETGDYLGLDRELPDAETGDLLFVTCAGAYGSSMASNYNSRPRAPEVLVDGTQFRVVRTRETLQSLWENE